MALIIDKEVTIFGNIKIPQIYIRFEAGVNLNGDFLQIRGRVYPSKDSYKLDPDQTIQSQSLFDDRAYGKNILRQEVPYNRESDGSDLLMMCHEIVVNDLTTDITREDEVMDPSTGEPMLDPSTGEQIYDIVVEHPAFTQLENITNTLLEDEEEEE